MTSHPAASVHTACFLKAKFQFALAVSFEYSYDLSLDLEQQATYKSPVVSDLRLIYQQTNSTQHDLRPTSTMPLK
jgi:hypothetical protein